MGSFGCVAGKVSAMVGLSVVLSACLVTSKVDYDQPIIPSELERTDPRPEEFTKVPEEPDEICVREGGGYMRFAVRIRDLNLEEGLVPRVVVNRSFAGQGEEIGPTHHEQREDYAFCVRESALRQSCSLVELLVSAKFKSSDRPYETRDDDLASVHWWVIGKAVDNTQASYLDCPTTVPDAGAL